MPLRLRAPRPGKTPNWEIRGSYLGVTVERSTGTAKKSVAARQLKDLIDAIERRDYPPQPQQPDAPTFLSAAIAYMKDGGERIYLKPLLKRFATASLDDVTQEAIDQAANEIYPNTAPITRNRRVHTPISAILHHAGRDVTIRRPKGYKGKQLTRFLLPPDAFAIIDAANRIDAEMGRLLTFLLYTGCRIGEALALKWENVDLDQGTAYIETSKNNDPRTIRMRADLSDLLRPHRAASGRVFRFRQGGHRNFLFLNSKVTACGLPPIKRPMRGKRMEIPPYRLSWVTFHTFCHTWATWMRRFGGADLQGLVATNRWRDPRSAARYAHVAAHEEWDRVDDLPARGNGGELPSRPEKPKKIQG